MIEQDATSAVPPVAADPQTRSLEAAIAAACAEVLGLEEVDSDANFAGLATNSIQVIQVISLLRETIHPDLPLRLFFAAPTIAGIVEEIAQFLATAPSATPADAAEEGEL